MKIEYYKNEMKIMSVRASLKNGLTELKDSSKIIILHQEYVIGYLFFTLALLGGVVQRGG